MSCCIKLAQMKVLHLYLYNLFNDCLCRVLCFERNVEVMISHHQTVTITSLFYTRLTIQTNCSCVEPMDNNTLCAVT